MKNDAGFCAGAPRPAPRPWAGGCGWGACGACANAEKLTTEAQDGLEAFERGEMSGRMVFELGQSFKGHVDLDALVGIARDQREHQVLRNVLLLDQDDGTRLVDRRQAAVGTDTVS